MRVLLVSHTYVARINRQKIYALVEEAPDIEITVVTPKEWSDDLLTHESEPETGERVRFVPLGSVLTGYESAYFYVQGLGKLLRRFQPDIVQVEQGEYALAYYQVLRLKERLSPEAKSIFFTWNNLYQEHSFLRRAIENYNLRHTDMAFVGNQEAEHILREKGFERDIRVLPQLGVDTGFFRRREAKRLRAELGLTEQVVGYVGWFALEKGLLTLVWAVSRLKEYPWQLLLLGAGSLEDDIRCLAQEEGVLDRLRIVHSVPHDQVADYLCCMDMLVLPSETAAFWKEQFGHVLIEAMACEVPVIGSSSGAIPDVIGDAGLIFREGNSRELARAIRRLLVDKDFARRLGEKGRRRVLEHFSHQVIARKTYESYQALLSRRQRR